MIVPCIWNLTSSSFTHSFRLQLGRVT
jgi:hypothetical protein